MAANISQQPQYKVIQRVGFSSERSNINAISWSSDNRLAIGRNGAVSMFSINGVNHNDKKGPKLKMARSIINADSKIDNDDQSFFYDQCLPMFMDSPCYSTAVIDPALCPTILKKHGLYDILFTKWSPVGCDKIGRSVLAVLFRTNKLCLYTSEQSANTWVEIVNLTEIHSAQLKKENFFKENITMRGKIPPDPRTTVGQPQTWDTFNEWQNHKYLLNFTCIEWCPAPITCPNALKKTKSKFAFLATVVKSGNLFIWQGLLPLMEHPGNSVQRVLAANTSLFYPCSLAWSSVGLDGTSYLACGNTAGLIKVFFIKISSTVSGLPRMSFVKAYTFLDQADDRSVDCLAWHSKENQLFLACSKGPEVSVFHSQLMDGGALSKPVRNIVTGIHLLNVTALTISPSGTLYSGSAEGTIQQFDIASCDQNTQMEYDSAPGFGCVGAAVSPNGVFLALLEYRRTSFLARPNTIDTPYQIALISLVTAEENHQKLMAWTSQPIGLTQLWDRFYFQEMFAQKLLESLIFPESLQGFSQSFLQFLRNLLASNPKWNPSTLEIVEPDKTSSANMDTGGEGSLPAQKLSIAKNIEERIAALVMGKILTAFLECRKKVGNNLHDLLLLAQEPLLYSICRWLAQKSPSDSTTKLLERIWTVFKDLKHYEESKDTDNQMDVDSNCDTGNPTSLSSGKTSQQFTNIRQKILESNDAPETCMCGEPIILQELRLARCVAGHAWPRCCVTFKVLDGTNCRVCVNCTAHALIQNPTSSSKLDWTKGLLEGGFACSFCGGWFECVR